jgi:hypothetical protein
VSFTKWYHCYDREHRSCSNDNKTIVPFVLKHVEGAVSVLIQLFVRSRIKGTEDKCLSRSCDVRTEVESCFYDADDTLMEDLHDQN